MVRRFVISIMILALLSFVTTGCNTFKGMGKDIETAGKAIEKTAEKAEKKLKE